MGKSQAATALYDVVEVEWLQSPGQQVVNWHVEGWAFQWSPSMLFVESQHVWIPLARLASPELAVAFSIGWHARGKLRELPSPRD